MSPLLPGPPRTAQASTTPIILEELHRSGTHRARCFLRLSNRSGGTGVLAAQLARLAGHCRLPVGAQRLAEIARAVRRPAGGEPVDTGALRDRASSNEWMRRWGYSC